MLASVGEKLGEFEIKAYLGEGAHVHAYLAHQASKNRDVVIKILKSSLASTAEFVERFKREAQAALDLTKHPNIVQIYSWHVDKDMLYIVEEFFDGGSLWDIFRKTPGPLPMDKTIKTMEQIGSALDFAHSKGIVHGDLKPENVLYDVKGNASITDLGITKDLDQKAARSRDGLTFGNPGYMSPEEWRSEAPDARTDIYALGILLFEMLTGQLPFENTFSGSQAYLHLMHLVTDPISLSAMRPDLPIEVEQIINKAMAKDRDARFKSAGEMVKAFKESVKGLATTGSEAKPVVKSGIFGRLAIPGSTEEQKPPASSTTFRAPVSSRVQVPPQPQSTLPPPTPVPVPVIERANFWLMVMALISGFLLAKLTSRRD